MAFLLSACRRPPDSSGRRPRIATRGIDSHFVFTRIAQRGRGLARGFGNGGWEHDYPTADRNLIVDYISNVRVRSSRTNILDRTTRGIRGTR